MLATTTAPRERTIAHPLHLKGMLAGRETPTQQGKTSAETDHEWRLTTWPDGYQCEKHYVNGQYIGEWREPQSTQGKADTWPTLADQMAYWTSWAIQEDKALTDHKKIKAAAGGHRNERAVRDVQKP